MCASGCIFVLSTYLCVCCCCGDQSTRSKQNGSCNTDEDRPAFVIPHCWERLLSRFYDAHPISLLGVIFIQLLQRMTSRNSFASFWWFIILLVIRRPLSCILLSFKNKLESSISYLYRNTSLCFMAMLHFSHGGKYDPTNTHITTVVFYQIATPRFQDSPMGTK